MQAHQARTVLNQNLTRTKQKWERCQHSQVNTNNLIPIAHEKENSSTIKQYLYQDKECFIQANKHDLYHTNKMKDKNNMSISMETKTVFNKNQHICDKMTVN